MEEVAGVESLPKLTSTQVNAATRQGVTDEHDPWKADKTSTEDACGDAIKTRRSGDLCFISDLSSALRLVDHRTVLGTLRFDDHRGIKPSDVTLTVTGRSMTSRLGRSKTIGLDRNVSSHMVYVHPCCYMSKSGWILEGWAVLKTAADCGGEYPLPSPATHCNGCLRSELRYDSVFALQNRVLHSLQVDKFPIIPRTSTTFWTPHSCPSATMSLVPREELDCLGSGQ